MERKKKTPIGKRPVIDMVKLKKNGGNFELDLRPITALPSVSVLTITKDRPHFLPLILHNWNSFKYPAEKIELIIIDDSKTDDLREMLLPEKVGAPPQIDARIKYFHLPVPLPIPDKRNFGVKKCTGEVIVHMDDDDFYFPDSVLAKVRVLIDNPKKKCVCSSPVGVYDILQNKSAIVDSKGKDIAESTFAYYKSFWKKSKFANHGFDSEWYGLLNGRWDEVINLPFWFNVVMTTHGKNATGSLRSLKRFPRGGPNFNQVWGEEVTEIIKTIKIISSK